MFVAKFAEQKHTQIEIPSNFLKKNKENWDMERIGKIGKIGSITGQLAIDKPDKLYQPMYCYKQQTEKYLTQVYPYQ